MMPIVKVRIAVAVDPKTLEWNSSGWGGGRSKQPTDGDKMGSAVEILNDGEQRFWVEAEVFVKPADEPAVIGIVLEGGA